MELNKRDLDRYITGSFGEDQYTEENEGELDQIFSDGRAARESGRVQSDCPFPSGTVEAQTWIDGWFDAKIDEDMI